MKRKPPGHFQGATDWHELRPQRSRPMTPWRQFRQPALQFSETERETARRKNQSPGATVPACARYPALSARRQSKPLRAPGRRSEVGLAADVCASSLPPRTHNSLADVRQSETECVRKAGPSLLVRSTIMILVPLIGTIRRCGGFAIDDLWTAAARYKVIRRHRLCRCCILVAF